MREALWGRRDGECESEWFRWCDNRFRDVKNAGLAVSAKPSKVMSGSFFKTAMAQ